MQAVFADAAISDEVCQACAALIMHAVFADAAVFVEVCQVHAAPSMCSGCQVPDAVK